MESDGAVGSDVEVKSTCVLERRKRHQFALTSLAWFSLKGRSDALAPNRENISSLVFSFARDVVKRMYRIDEANMKI